jgi:hypothetical protein
MIIKTDIKEYIPGRERSKNPGNTFRINPNICFLKVHSPRLILEYNKKIFVELGRYRVPGNSAVKCGGFSYFSYYLENFLSQNCS